jgi:hypothetical protein
MRTDGSDDGHRAHEGDAMLPGDGHQEKQSELHQDDDPPDFEQPASVGDGLDRHQRHPAGDGDPERGTQAVRLDLPDVTAKEHREAHDVNGTARHVQQACAQAPPVEIRGHRSRLPSLTPTPRCSRVSSINVSPTAIPKT